MVEKAVRSIDYFVDFDDEKQQMIIQNKHIMYQDIECCSLLRKPKRQTLKMLWLM